VPAPPPPAVPQQRTESITGASPPHLAGLDELGPPRRAETDWWRVDATPFGPGETVPGFVGGVEVPEILKPPPQEEPEEPADPQKTEADGRPRSWWSSVLRRTPPAPESAKPQAEQPGSQGKPKPAVTYSPLLLLAAALLVAGAVLGSLLVVAAGWLLAYASRRLSPVERKAAVLGVPGAIALSGIVWLWGRVDERWGEPIAEGRLGDAVTEMWPWVLRAAAVASALFLVWRARRPRA
jgi:hypothetical protein